MPDRAEHPVLLVQHRRHAQPERVERHDHVAHVLRATCRDRIDRRARLKRAGGGGETAQRPRNPPCRPKQWDQRDTVQDQRLRDEPPEDRGIIPRPREIEDQPLPVGPLDRHHQLGPGAEQPLDPHLADIA